MRSFAFCSCKAGDEVTVRAAFEADARVAAMRALWGGDEFVLPLDPGFVGPYLGLGLSLVG